MEQASKLAHNQVDLAIQAGLYKEAFEIASLWAEKGYGWAELSIGTMYQTGIGVERSAKSALYFLQSADKNNIAGAAHSLGVLYPVGDIDFPSNQKTASHYFERARELNFIP